MSALAISSEPILSYGNELNEEKKKLEDESYSLQQSIRAGRRRFMDNGPQEGIASILGLQTRDDKVLLIFWISYIVGVSAIVVALTVVYGRSLSSQQKIGFGFSAILIAVIVAYLAILRFA